MIIIYDGECFFCTQYIRRVRLMETAGSVELINAREADLAVWSLTPGELNEGMVVIDQGRYYKGAAALHYMALLSTPHSWFNRINRFLFRHRILAGLLYPFFRAGRYITLRLMGKNLLR